jgi:hypothetical protein
MVFQQRREKTVAAGAKSAQVIDLILFYCYIFIPEA